MTRLVSAGVALVGSSVDDALAFPEGEVGAAVSGGGPLAPPGGGGSLGSMVGIVGWLGVVGGWTGGLLGAAAASSNHDGVVTTEKFIT